MYFCSVTSYRPLSVLILCSKIPQVLELQPARVGEAD